MRVLFLSLFVTLALGARESDRVTFLPGLDPQPEFNHYAGHLNGTGTKKLFYWFVESEGNPEEDPLVLWLNGGPGCSSLTGKLIELGPWRVRPDGSGLTWFEHRWNKLANIIFLESPQCVGFSYAEDGNCSSSDDQSALDNHMAMRHFMEEFPEYQNRPFYITGESYAGVYVPVLAARIVDDPDFNFIAFGVGNPVGDRRIMGQSMVYYSYPRGIYGNFLFDNLVAECCENGNTSDCNFYDHEGILCNVFRSEVTEWVWRRGLNPYNLYQNCFGFSPNKYGVMRETETFIEIASPEEMSLSKQEYDVMKQYQATLPPEIVRLSIPCSDTSDRENYLNRPDVREALHIPEEVGEWYACSSNVSRNYIRNYSDMSPFYQKVLEEGKYILHFSGDLDMAVDHLGSYWFIEALGQPTLADYNSWFAMTDDNTTQIAGFVQQYTNLKFVTVKGAGHFVPTDKPQAAFLMFQKFLNDESYP